MSGLTTPGGPGNHAPPAPHPTTPQLYCIAKRKKGNKKKKERESKQKLLKGCYQGQNVIVLAIPERLEFKSFSCRSTMAADNISQCSMVAPLWNPFRRPCLTIFYPKLDYLEWYWKGRDGRSHHRWPIKKAVQKREME